MAGGKQTPRQKMIGMMYLVLTAMLALNVSAEVLEAFVLVDKGLNQTLKSFSSKNEDYYNLIKSAENNNPTKAAKWRQKADIVRAKSAEFCKYIEDIKRKIVETCDGKDAAALTPEGIDGHEVQGKSDTSVPANILLGPSENGEAYTLKKKLEQYKKDLLALIGPDEKFGPTLTIENILDTKDPKVTKDGTNRTWETSRFEGVPLISTLPLLSKFQVDVLNCEAIMLDYFFKQIDAADVRVNMFEPVLIPESSSVLKGEKFKATLMLAAYDKTQQPLMSINGRSLPVVDGKAIFEEPATMLGERTLKCQIVVTGPDGTKTPYPQDFKYQVVQPMFTVSPTKMNVLYRGIDNPMELSVSGVPSERVEVKISNASYRRSANGYLVNPQDGRVCEVNVWVKNNGVSKLMGSSSFRVKPLPAPIPKVDGASGKFISKSALMSSLGIRAEMPQDFDFDLRYTIRSFTIASRNSEGYDVNLSSGNASFTDEQKRAFASMKAGNRLTITDVKAVGPDGKVVELQDLVYKIR